ncbi:MAG: ATP-binding protein, partial [Deltaproteobacteria bacterium]|nr:ATP-binding protein [Deltaproteobacteria bacterium]
HNLAHRLREPRVASIVSAVLSGDDDVPANTDDFDYCVDLGLLDPVARPARVANPLYREVVARQLALRGQENLWLPDAPWLAADGTLDAAVLVGTFLQWWRENSDFATRNTPEGYHEATVHLCVMAFVQKVVNGGGRVTREYAAGTGRVDLCVEVAGKRTLIEVKRVRPGRESPERVLREGQAQLAAYLDRLGETEGWLLVFDQRPGISWDERMWSRDVVAGGKTLRLRGA